jgi:hypothetical protein
VARLIHFSRGQKNSYVGLVHKEENDGDENLLTYECISLKI